ncbi:metal-dependent hydrolase [Zobellella aerophila]|uniref:Metal-dependent hydrolase n=1 Tax=Zobellella aerophila TaxID=870480 RepID=A0ABP6WDB8_9GAMM
MADFKTHTQVAAVVSGGLAGLALFSGLASLPEALLYWAAGTLGGILPDIDSDSSMALRIVFRCFGAMAAALAATFAITLWSVPLALGLGGLAYLLVRYPLCQLFAHFSVHRGVLHSLLANLLFTLVAVVLAHRLFHLSPQAAWGVGGFVFIGATLHLLLDELYSVDLAGMRIKQSFGTALKLTDWSAPGWSLLLVLQIAACWWLAPSPLDWQQVWQQQQIWPWSAGGSLVPPLQELSELVLQGWALLIKGI